MTHGDEAVIVLRANGVSVAFDTGHPVPRVLHWGADLGDLGRSDRIALARTAIPAVLNNSPDLPRAFTIWPTEFDGWSGTPGQEGHADSRASTPRPTLVDTTVEFDADNGGGIVEFRLADRVSALRATARYALDRFGVLTVDLEVTRDATLNPSTGRIPYALGSLMAFMPVPERASELLDFSGKWCRERAPQRRDFGFGTHLRRARRGKPGHDSPFLLMAGSAGFGFGRGEVWAAHLAWSGDQQYLAERLPEGAGALAAVVGVGESLRPGEIVLADGDRYRAPTAVFVWSGSGMDGVAQRLHTRLRARPTHPSSPRPLVLNTWEAVYFDHDLPRLTRLVDRAAEVGVERVVLDDGWFHGRRNSDAGLGDWSVDADAWPNGLGPLVDLVHGHGMQFGLWFEPEMVNLDSDLARAHPNWVLGPSEGLGPASRNQYVLDIARPEAYDYVLDRIDGLIREYSIDYLKWDHNRDLLEPVSRETDGDRPSVNRQTRALYAMLDELRSRHPLLEIETCSGGGGRIDLGIIDRTDRVWASDCNDPVERVAIERWTRLLLPPELIGSHLGAGRAHTTGRTTDIGFRLAASLGGHAGIEQDLTEATAEELARISSWSALYREFRHLLHTGRVVNADLSDEATALYGTIADDDARALFVWARFATSAAGQSGRVRFPGLDRSARYTVRIREELGDASRHQGADPAWVTDAIAGEFRISGAILVDAGLPLPTLNPQQAMLIDLTRVAS